MYSDKTFRTAPPAAANTFCAGPVRIQFITDRLVRLEWQEHGRFEDRQTLAVVNRDLGKVKFTVEQQKKRYVLKTSALTLELTDVNRPFSADTLKISFNLGKKSAVWQPGRNNDGNLGATIRTLDCVYGNSRMQQKKDPGVYHKYPIYELQPVDLGNGLLSRDGWSLVDDSRNIVIDRLDGHKWVCPRPEGSRQDWYFFAYGHDYTAAVAAAAGVFGSQPLPPRYTLGYWWSRYWAYCDTEIEGLVRGFDRNGVPIDVMVIDMDWHLPGWTGYTWDRRYFPDPDEHLAWLHRQGLKVTLNLHPAEGVGKQEDQFSSMCKAMDLDAGKCDKVPFDITSQQYMDNYFKLLHHPEENRGIDFWWMDWQQGESTAIPGLDTLPWINQLHWEDMENRPERHGKRPLIFSRFGGYGAGRYNIGFSGDTYSTWDSLAFQPYFTATAANVLYGYWSHDIGGHMPGAIEPELYTRWIQFGTYSPIIRTHTTKNPDAERRVWEYPVPYNEIMIDAIRRRYMMVPYIYSENRKAFDTGVSLCRPMYYHWPEVEAAYRCPNQYMFGDEMIVAPVVKPVDPSDDMAEVSVWLPEGNWFDAARGKMEKGGQVITRRYLLQEVPVFVRPGAVIPAQAVVKRLNSPCYRDLAMRIYPGARGSYALYEDDGLTTDYLKGQAAVIAMTHQTTGNTKTIKVVKKSGGFTGYEAKRSLEISLCGSIPPTEVKVGNKKLAYAYRLEEQEEGWSYQGMNATAVIKIKSFDLDKGIEVKVRYPAKGDQADADGLKGQFARLAKVREINVLMSSWVDFHPEERLAQDIFCTANRISRGPETFADEIETMKQNLKHLLEVIPEQANATTDNGVNDNFKKRLEQGRLSVRLLQSILGQ